MIAKLFKWAASSVRLLFYKLRYGSRLCLSGRVYLGKRCRIEIGPDARVTLNGVYLSEGCYIQCESGRLTIGDRTYFNTFCRVCAKESVTIGADCMFGSNVSVYDHDHDVSRGVKNAGKAYVTGAVILEESVWCGTNAVITRGSTVKRNCVIGANAVVTGTLEESGVYAGIPAVRKKTVPEG